MNACIFWPNIHLIHKRVKNIHDLNAYNEYSLGKLYSYVYDQLPPPLGEHNKKFKFTTRI